METKNYKDYTVFKIPGDLVDYDVIQEVYLELKKAVEENNVTKIILDFEDVNMINSSAIGKILFLNKILDKKSGELIFVNLKDSIKTLFNTILLDKMFKIYDSLDQI